MLQECAADEIPSGLKGSKGGKEPAALKYSEDAQADLSHHRKGEDGGGDEGCEDSGTVGSA